MGRKPDLQRFKDAQNRPAEGFEKALEELSTGGKRSHWIWYVFPQISGLGSSHMSQSYAIADEEEAAAYLRDEELRSRLLEITTTVAEQLKSGEVTSLRRLMGGETDAQKLVSSLTLFGRVARRLQKAEGPAYAALAEAADDVLTMAANEGYPPCAHTLRRIGAT